MPAATCASTARSSPRDRSHARSAMVALVPGSTTRSASPSARGSETNTTSTSGSRPSASTSVKLLIRGSLTTATRRAPDAVARRPCRSSASSESSHTSGCHGSVPYTRRPVTRSRSRSPGANRSRSPRNLLTTNPATSAWSSRRQQRDGAEERREHATAIDVTDHDRRQLGVASEAHVDVIACAQVDLGRTARTLGHHDVETGRPGRRTPHAPPSPAGADPPASPRTTPRPTAGPSARRGCGGRCPA